jgi:hypothetical protein
MRNELAFSAREEIQPPDFMYLGRFLAMPYERIRVLAYCPEDASGDVELLITHIEGEGAPGHLDQLILVPGSTVNQVYEVPGVILGFSARATTDASTSVAVSVWGFRPGLGGTRPAVVAPPPPPPPPDTNPLDESLPTDALTLSSVSPNAFNSTDAQLRFDLAGSTFGQDDKTDSVLTVNGQAVPAAKVTITDESIIAEELLVDGKNVIHVASVDSVGRPLYLDRTIWGGNGTLNVNLTNEDGTPFLDEAAIRLSLVDDQTIGVEATTNTGVAVFENVPRDTVLIQATASGNRMGVIGTLGSVDAVTVAMIGFNPASGVDNNDLSHGTDGWHVGSAPVDIVPHRESIGPSPEQAPPMVDQASPSDDPDERQRRHALATEAETRTPQLLVTDETSGPRASVSPPAGNQSDSPHYRRRQWWIKRRRQTIPTSASSGMPMRQEAQDAFQIERAPIVDNDLRLTTYGIGEQSTSRTFQTDPDVIGVLLRYRFRTREVPAGYFGRRFNDYFRVSLRSQNAGGVVLEVSSMNALGEAAFDSEGSTAWRDVTLPLDIDGDVIQVDVGVANVFDGLIDSEIIIDFIEEIRVRVVPTLTWNSTQGGVDVRYSVQGAKLPESRDVAVSFGNGPGYGNRIGGAFFTHSVPEGTEVGQYGPERIAGNALTNDPVGTTHLIASTTLDSVGPLPDVHIAFGPNANAGVVSAPMLDVVKDGLRAAGQSTGTIMSTARTPADQARAMFNNLINPANPIAVNVANQLNHYFPPGDAVINEFVAQTQDMTPQQIQQNAMNIRDAMEQEILDQGPENVSQHCADPSEVSVVDVSAAAFNANNAPLFVAAVQGRVTKFIDERVSNGCFHLEL